MSRKFHATACGALSEGHRDGDEMAVHFIVPPNCFRNRPYRSTGRRGSDEILTRAGRWVRRSAHVAMIAPIRSVAKVATRLVDAIQLVQAPIRAGISFMCGFFHYRSTTS